MTVISLLEVARHAIELGYDGMYLSPIQDALLDYGIDKDIADENGATNELILEIESIADTMLEGK